MSSSSGDNYKPPSNDKKKKTMELVQTMREQLDQDTTRHKGDSWDQLWQQGVTPWDLNMPTPVLQHELHVANTTNIRRMLVPGCGSGFDLVTMAEQLPNAQLIVGLDISATSLERAKEVLLAKKSDDIKQAAKIVLAEGDFFDTTTWKTVFSTSSGDQEDNASLLQQPELALSFDLIYDYVFFCALPPELRPAWGKSTANLLSPLGQLLTLMFPILPDADPSKGPPFPITLDDYQSVLNPHGVQLQSSPYVSPHSVPSRQGKELVAWWTSSKSHDYVPESPASKL